MRHAFATSALLGLDVGPLEIGPTPLAILISVLAVGAVITVLLLIFSQVGGAVVDKRWPANEPLTPSEVLWGESGGHVKKTFPGLDPAIARDLTQYIVTKKVAPGTVIIEAGDLPTQFVLLKSGGADQVGPSGSTKAGPGASFGADNIIRRTPFEFSLTATAPTEVVSLGAEDYLAALALGMSDDDDDYVVNVLGGYLSGEAPPAAAGGGTATATMAPVAPAFAAPALRPQWSSATHRLSGDLPAYLLPAGDAVTRTLPSGSEVQVVESLPGWAHVRTSDGWQGWINDAALVRF